MLRIITLNLNGIRSAVAKGFLRLARATKGRLRVHAGDQGASNRLAKVQSSCQESSTGISTSRTRRATAASACTARRTPDAIVDRLRQPRVRSRGALPARRLRQAFGRVDVSALGLELGRAPAGEVPLHARVHAGAREAGASGREFILCGDWNIAHQEIDLKNWRSNRKNSGFLPEERAWLSRGVRRGRLGRRVPPPRPAPRAVHLVVEPRPGLGEERGLAHRLPDRHAGHRGEGADSASIYKAQRFSDHAPLTIDYDWTL